MDFDRMSKIFMVVWVAGVVISVAFLCGVVAVAWHFIAKFW